MANIGRSCCFTGYRPSKFPFEISIKDKDYLRFENALTRIIFSMLDEECYTFYSGMAMGLDIIAAETVLLLKRAHPELPINLICAVPFVGQSDNFTDEWKERYDSVLEAADETIIISDKYYKGCYLKRNKFMVDNSDFVITWFDGKPGGTKTTIDYAKQNGRAVINLNEN